MRCRVIDCSSDCSVVVAVRYGMPVDDMDVGRADPRGSSESSSSQHPHSRNPTTSSKLYRRSLLLINTSFVAVLSKLPSVKSTPSSPLFDEGT